MQKIVFTILVVLATSAVFGGEPDKDFHEKCLYPTVLVHNNKPVSSGTGVIVKCIPRNGKFLNYTVTCAHILRPIPVEKPVEPPPTDPDTKPDPEEEIEHDVAPPPPIDKSALVEGTDVAAAEEYDVVVRIGIYEDWSKLIGQKEHKCEVVELDRENDIALLSFVTETKCHVAEIYKNPKLYIGNDVLRIGCGLGDPFRVDFGKITSVKDSIGLMLKGTYRTSIPTVIGDSGGPVFHEGKVIGLAQAIRSQQVATPFGPLLMPVYHMSYVIPTQRFLDNKKIAALINLQK